MKNSNTKPLNLNKLLKKFNGYDKNKFQNDKEYHNDVLVTLALLKVM